MLSLLSRGIIEEGEPSENYHLLELWEEEDGFHMAGTGRWINGKVFKLKKSDISPDDSIENSYVKYRSTSRSIPISPIYLISLLSK